MADTNTVANAIQILILDMINLVLKEKFESLIDEKLDEFLKSKFDPYVEEIVKEYIKNNDYVTLEDMDVMLDDFVNNQFDSCLENAISGMKIEATVKGLK
jgi:hypothetical protein